MINEGHGVVDTQITYISVYYNGKTKAEQDFLRYYFDEEGYEDYDYGIITSAVFAFDNSGNIVGRYEGGVSIFAGTLMYITTMEDDPDLYRGKVLYILDVRTGKPIFKKPYGALCSSESYSYLNEDMFPESMTNLDFDDWYVVSPKQGEAVAINYQTGQIVKVPFDSYWFN